MYKSDIQVSEFIDGEIVSRVQVNMVCEDIVCTFYIKDASVHTNMADNLRHLTKTGESHGVYLTEELTVSQMVHKLRKYEFNFSSIYTNRVGDVIGEFSWSGELSCGKSSYVIDFCEENDIAYSTM